MCSAFASWARSLPLPRLHDRARSPLLAEVRVVIGEDLVIRPQILGEQAEDKPAAPDEHAPRPLLSGPLGGDQEGT
jgi:hypothetical protein